MIDKSIPFLHSKLHSCYDKKGKYIGVINNMYEDDILDDEDIEFNHETGEKLINVFYTKPYSSWQKGGIERNHEFIRYIIPKGITFDNLNKKNIIDMMNNINNVQRESLDYQTPYDIFLKQYGEDVSKKLHLQKILKDEINLSYKLLNK